MGSPGRQLAVYSKGGGEAIRRRYRSRSPRERSPERQLAVYSRGGGAGALQRKL